MQNGNSNIKHETTVQHFMVNIDNHDSCKKLLSLIVKY